MKNLSNLLAIFALVAMMGLVVGCGCGTSNTPAREDMVNTGEETLPPGNNTTETPAVGEAPNTNTNNNTLNNADAATEPIVDRNGNLIDNNNPVGENGQVPGNEVNGNNNTTGNVVDDAGNAVGNVVEDAGNAVQDVGRGVKDMTNDVTR